jgi:pimeloyl-ACP methyl ester carboxylesterase
LRHRIIVSLAILSAFPWRVSAQVVPAIPPEISLGFFDVFGRPSLPVYTLMPDGTQSPVLQLNQPIGMTIYFTAANCPNTIYCSAQGIGVVQTTASFHVDAPGTSRTSTSGTDVCGPATLAGNPPQFAELSGAAPNFAAYFYYSTPGTKTVTITANDCTNGGILAKKLVTFNIGAALFDPIPGDLSPGSAAVSINADTLVSNGRPIVGVAADGVSLALLKIPAVNAGDPFTVALLNDQNGTSSSTDEDGALGVPGQTTYSSSQVSVNAVATTSQGAYAFVVYRAPVDFARLTAGVPGSYKSGTCALQSGTDNTLPCRSVSLQIQGLTPGSGPTNTVSIPVTIVRPPVVLIHGLWGKRAAWDTFAPLYSAAGGMDPRFHVDRVAFSGDFNGQVVASDPIDAPHSGFQENALGFAYNAGRIRLTVRDAIQAYKMGGNPVSAPVAAIQADIVGHSMGGDITRTLPLQPAYLDQTTLYQGYIHKVITIATPHLGSPLATQLLDDNNLCTRTWMKRFGSPSIRTLTLSGGQTILGAVGDLAGDGTGATLSPALTNIATPGPTLIKTAFIVGVANASNFASLGQNVGAASVITSRCTSSNPNNHSDPLAVAMTPTGWPALFPASGSDAIVPVVSQMNGLSVGPDSEFQGYVHSPGLVGRLGLGFTGPSVLDIDPGSQMAPVALQVIRLLNTPITQSVFNSLNP